MRRVFRWVGVLGGRVRIARELDDELAFHLEMRTRQLAAAGMSADEARREALRQFGDVSGVRAQCLTLDEERERDARRADLLGDLWRDATYAARTLRRSVGFTLAVVAMLSLGIGANVAIFSLVEAVMLRHLPVSHPEELIAVGDPARTASMSNGDRPRGDLLSWKSYLAMRDSVPFLRGLVATGVAPRLDIRAGEGSEVEHARGRMVSANYFRVLGVGAEAGRTFDGSEDALVGAAPVAVISDGYWARRFDRSRDVVGRKIVVNGVPITVIGVAAPGFSGTVVGQSDDVWLPIAMEQALSPQRQWLDSLDVRWLLLLGRRAPGVSEAQAAAALTTMVRRISEAQARTPQAATEARALQVFVESGARGFSHVRATYRLALITLMAGVALLMLIICANVANLLLARAVARRHEIGVRMAIGAGRDRIVRQLLVESALLALAGTAGGLLVAGWGSRLLLVLASAGPSPIPLDLRIGGPVLVFTVVTAAAAVLLFGLVPAVRASRVDLAGRMRERGRAAAGGLAARGARIPMGAALIVAQVALSLVLLAGAALLVRNLRAMVDADTGLDRDHLLVVDVDGVGRGYTGDRLRALATELRRRVSQLPGVAAVSFSDNGLFNGSESEDYVRVPGLVARTPDDSMARTDQIGPGYVKAIGARLLQGRDLTAADAGRAAPVAIVNESFARYFFKGESAIGREFGIGDSARYQIVGVVGDVRDHTLTAAPERRYYVAYLEQAGDPPGSLRLIVRATGNPAALTAAVRAELKATDPLLVATIDPLSRLMRDSVAEQRLLARLAAGFGVVALLLAAIGLYGVVSYAVSRRTGEIGLRMALGAAGRDVLALVMGDAMRLVAAGAALGLPLALGVMRLVGAQLHGVGALDAVSLLVAIGVLALAAALAALVPALRAARVPPTMALTRDS